jgi:hypothetical protein
MSQRDCTPIHDSWPPHAKNHAILLLQMQGCSQSNAKQDFFFFFKDTLKAIASFFKTKATQTKFFLLQQTIQKKKYGLRNPN